MKYFLVISILLNLFLGYKIQGLHNDNPKLERIILEADAPNKKLAVAAVKKVHLPKLVKSDTILPPTDTTMYSEDVTSLAETMDQDRQEFIEKNLTLPPEKIKRHNELRTVFHMTINKIFAAYPGQLPMKQRRLLLDLEDKLNTDLENLYGKANWKRFERFRENYNKQGMKRQREQNQPFLFMSP